MLDFIVFDAMEECSQAEVERLLPLVSPQRREQALRYKFLFGQYACLKSYELLGCLLCRFFLQKNIQKSPISSENCRFSPCNLTFDFNEHGKPRFVDFPDLHFNLSHCKNGIAIVLADHPVGIDIESIRHTDEPLIRRTMNAEEQAAIASDIHPDAAFTQLWTQKEAVLKMRGTGLVDDLYSVLQPQKSESYQLDSHLLVEKGYAWSLCY